MAAGQEAHNMVEEFRARVNEGKNGDAAKSRSSSAGCNNVFDV